MEGRDRLGGTPPEEAAARTQSRNELPPNLERVKQAARRDRRTKFTALLHHVNVESLGRAFARLKRNASPGVDGRTVAEYEQDLEANLAGLAQRVHRGSYKPLPVRRVHIPKPDGGKRPLGILSLEDKIVQGAVAELLGVIYEEDFKEFSYGFRPGRDCHQALEAVQTALIRQPVNYVLDADIRSFFDSVDHEWLLRMLAERIADPRILRLIEQWLGAGVLESGEWQATERGTPQGAGISPLLANIFLHYALDNWLVVGAREAQWGEMFVVRYADDFVMGFKHECDGLKMLADLKQRLAKFGLALHEEKTRLIEFGRFAAERRARRGERRPETFNFLGFTHYCSQSREGRFVVKRKTQSKRRARKLKELRVEMKRRMHEPVAEQHRWLSSVLRGQYAYFGLPCNLPALKGFWYQTKRLWYRALKRRSRKASLNWQGFGDLLAQFPLPEPHITHPWRPAQAASR